MYLSTDNLTVAQIHRWEQQGYDIVADGDNPGYVNVTRRSVSPSKPILDPTPLPTYS